MGKSIPPICIPLSHPQLKLSAPFMLANVELKCAEGWEHFEGKCFKPIPIERSWPQALAFCSRWAKLIKLNILILFN